VRHLPVLLFALALFVPAIAVAGNMEDLRSGLAEHLAEEFQKEEFLPDGYSYDNLMEMFKKLNFPKIQKRKKFTIKPNSKKLKKDLAEARDKLYGFDKKYASLYENMVSIYKKRFNRAPSLIWKTDIIKTILIYRKNFLYKSGYEAGREYLSSHIDDLERAEKEYGVPKEIITAILWVESAFAENKGKKPALDILYKKSIRELYYSGGDKSNSEYSAFRQLFYLLLIAKELGMNPAEIKGSFAAALGIPQFLSSSYRHYAVDGDGDGIINLFESHSDAIFSVANYLKEHGWDSNPEKAVWRYNNSSVYVFTIFEYAKKIKK